MALTVAQSVLSAEGSPPWSASFTSSVSSGSGALIAIVAGWAGGVTADNPFPLIISDNVNTGAWTLINSYFDTTTSYWGACYYKIPNATGTPTVTATASADLPEQTAFMAILQVTGFVGTPTVDVGASVQSFNHTATTTQSGSVSAAYNNEILLAAPWNVSYISSPPGNWTYVDITDSCYYAVVGSAGANNFSGTLGSSSATLTVFGGIYDNSSSGLTVTQQLAFNGNPPSGTLGSPVASGSVIIVTSQNDTDPVSDEIWSDNVNSGNYTLLADQSGSEPAIFWKVANATGTPTISCSGSAGTVYATAFVVTGWHGTPTADTALTAAWTGTSSTLAASPLTTNHNNEILLAVSSYYGGAYGAGSSTGWTIERNAPNYPNWDAGYGAYAIGVNSGASLPISAAISSSQNWFISVGGIYDATGSSTTILTAASGSFALTGESAAFSLSQTASLTFLANPAAFNFTGALSQSQTLAIMNAGTFALTGEGASLQISLGAFSISGGYGTFALTGENAVLQDLTYTFSAFTGDFTLTGEAATFISSLSGPIYPNVVGMDYYVAVEILVANGLQVATPILKAVKASVGLPGVVLAQSVTPGTALVVNTPVTLTVASESLLSVTDTQPLPIFGPI